MVAKRMLCFWNVFIESILDLDWIFSYNEGNHLVRTVPQKAILSPLYARELHTPFKAIPGNIRLKRKGPLDKER